MGLRIPLARGPLAAAFAPPATFAALPLPAALAAIATLLGLAVLLAPGAPAIGAEAAPYEIVSRNQPGGEGGWDYLTVDPAAHRLYVSRSTHMMVVDTRTDSVVGDIPNTPGVHGVALVPALGRGFTSNGRDSSVTVFDLATFATIATVRLPARGPDAIVYDPASKRVFTFNGGSSTATAIDAATNTVTGTVVLGGRPEAAVPDGNGRVFVNLEDSSAVACFDTRSLKVLARWPLAPGEEPTGLAFDRAHHRLFSGCGNHRLIVLDSESGKRVADLPIGGGVDGVAFDAGLQRVISSNGEGTLSVFHEDGPDRYASIGEVPTQRGARTIALDETTHRVYTATAQFGEPPAPTPERPHPRPSLVPGSFVVITLEAKGAAAAKR